MWNYMLFSILILFLSFFYHCYFNKPASMIEHPETDYDYIIVGAGTSGCVLASRLSEVSNVTVLLIEAGGYFGWVSSVPLLSPMTQGTEFDWSYLTEPQKFSSKGFWNYVQKVPRGKGLGGSGQINHLVHSFGRPDDYNGWPEGWSHADLLPYFERVSDIMNVMSSPEEEFLVDAFLSAEDALNTSHVTLQKGLYTVKKGSRWSTYHAYLQNAWNRKNLHILTNTLVSKIFFKDGAMATVDGVKVIYKSGSIGRIGARKEVILCAGVINTPQLLMLSGIGPAEDLNKFQISIVSNLPAVGKNLFDQIMLPIYVNLEARVSMTLFKLQTLPEVVNYFVFGRGWYATNGIMGIGRTNNSGVMLFGMGSTEERLLKSISNYMTEVTLSVVQQQFSRGLPVLELLFATEESRDHHIKVEKHSTPTENRSCLFRTLRRYSLHARGDQLCRSNSGVQDVPRVRREGTSSRSRRMPSPAAGLSEYRVF
ncbi:glucose dehydrogenase [FAD, quinone] isoform X2 [Augochlora pura]